jgi:uncharacterized protein
MPTLVDTGILYALADEDDAWHDRAVEWISAVDELLLVPVTVLPEVCYLIHARLGPAAERRFVASLIARELEVEGLRGRDVERTGELMDRYPDLGFTDLSIAAMAERLKIRTVATTDRRHFARIVPKHVAGFNLVPA